MTTRTGAAGRERLPLAVDLNWRSPGTGRRWLDVRAGYVERLADTLGGLLARSEAVPGSSRLMRTLEQLPAGAIEEFLVAPRVSNLLLWVSLSAPPGPVLDELDALARLELATLGGPAGGSGWAARGDRRIDGTHLAHQQQVAGLPPLDLTSPHARSIDLVGETWTTDRPRAELPPLTRHGLCRRLDSAVRIIAASGDHVPEFVNLFTIVLVGQVDDDHLGFSSGTCWQYLGRSVLTNFGPREVSLEFLAEAIVHERVRLPQHARARDTVGARRRSVRTRYRWSAPRSAVPAGMLRVVRDHALLAGRPGRR